MFAYLVVCPMSAFSQFDVSPVKLTEKVKQKKIVAIRSGQRRFKCKDSLNDDMICYS